MDQAFLDNCQRLLTVGKENQELKKLNRQLQDKIKDLESTIIDLRQQLNQPTTPPSVQSSPVNNQIKSIKRTSTSYTDRIQDQSLRKKLKVSDKYYQCPKCPLQHLNTYVHKHLLRDHRNHRTNSN